TGTGTAINYGFGNPALGLGNDPLVGPGLVGYQGLSNFGTGRISPTAGIGGFVFSAVSESFSLLVRALQTQQRLDVLSRPQIMTLDQQAAVVSVGQSVPTASGSNVTTGVVTNNVVYRDVGVVMN